MRPRHECGTPCLATAQAGLTQHSPDNAPNGTVGCLHKVCFCSLASQAAPSLGLSGGGGGLGRVGAGATAATSVGVAPSRAAAGGGCMTAVMGPSGAGERHAGAVFCAHCTRHDDAVVACCGTRLRRTQPHSPTLACRMCFVSSAHACRAVSCHTHIHTHAGKTSLLDCLAGRRTGPGRTGVVRLNGHPVTAAQVRLAGCVCVAACQRASVCNCVLRSPLGLRACAAQAPPRLSASPDRVWWFCVCACCVSTEPGRASRPAAARAAGLRAAGRCAAGHRLGIRGAAQVMKLFDALHA